MANVQNLIVKIFQKSLTFEGFSKAFLKILPFLEMLKKVSVRKVLGVYKSEKCALKYKVHKLRVVVQLTNIEMSTREAFCLELCPGSMNFFQNEHLLLGHFFFTSDLP